ALVDMTQIWQWHMYDPAVSPEQHLCTVAHEISTPLRQALHKHPWLSFYNLNSLIKPQ
ncbi:hypothetical protein PAXRUDRAFT_166503, partial [Paxillus rubicundulus Ve08.2h10]